MWSGDVRLMLTIMAYQNKHRSFLAQQSDASLDPQSKLAVRDPPRRLKTIKEIDLSQASPMDSLKGPMGKGSTIQGVDLTNTSPYAASLKCSLNRSKSLTKARTRNPVPPKHSTPEKERPSKLTSFHTRTASIASNPARLVSTPLRLYRLKKKHSEFTKSFDRSDELCPPGLSMSFNNSFNTLISAGGEGGVKLKEAAASFDLKAVYQVMVRKLKAVT